MRYCVCFVLAVVACVSLAQAQTMDTVMLGTVADPRGAQVAGATVTITQPCTGLSHTATTSADGSYEIRYLVPGEYVVEVRANGFRGERRPGRSDSTGPAGSAGLFATSRRGARDDGGELRRTTVANRECDDRGSCRSTASRGAAAERAAVR